MPPLLQLPYQMHLCSIHLPLPFFPSLPFLLTFLLFILHCLLCTLTCAACAFLPFSSPCLAFFSTIISSIFVRTIILRKDRQEEGGGLGGLGKGGMGLAWAGLGRDSGDRADGQRRAGLLPLTWPSLWGSIHGHGWHVWRGHGVEDSGLDNCKAAHTTPLPHTHAGRLAVVLSHAEEWAGPGHGGISDEPFYNSPFFCPLPTPTCPSAFPSHHLLPFPSLFSFHGMSSFSWEEGEGVGTLVWWAFCTLGF